MGEHDSPPRLENLMTKDLSEARGWLSEVDVWLVENIDSKFASKAQVAAKHMREITHIMRSSWDVLKSGKPYVYVSRLIHNGSGIRTLTDEEVRVAEDKLREEKLKQAQTEYDKWLSTLYYHIRIVSAYVEKIHGLKKEVRMVEKRVKEEKWDLLGYETDVEIHIGRQLVRKSNRLGSPLNCKPVGKKIGLNQERERGFKVLALFRNGTTSLTSDEVRTKLKIPKTRGSNYMSKYLGAARRILRDIDSSYSLSEPRGNHAIQLVEKMD